jgi:hypothetical protein
MYSASKDLTDVLQSFAEFEWGKGSIYIKKDEDWQYPPVIVWRYKEKDERRDQLIVEAVESFEGSTKWAISFRDRERLPGRNWMITPQRLEKFRKEIKDDPDIFDVEGAFAATEPEVGEVANREIPQLAEHIKKFVQARLSLVQ